MRKHVEKRVRMYDLIINAMAIRTHVDMSTTTTPSTCSYLELRGVSTIAVVIRHSVFFAESRLENLANHDTVIYRMPRISASTTHACI